jgi:hypothetical protein
MGSPEQLPQDDFEQGFAGSMSGNMTEVILQGRTSARIAITGRFDQAKLVSDSEARDDLPNSLSFSWRAKLAARVSTCQSTIPAINAN